MNRCPPVAFTRRPDTQTYSYSGANPFTHDGDAIASTRRPSSLLHHTRTGEERVSIRRDPCSVSTSVSAATQSKNLPSRPARIDRSVANAWNGFSQSGSHTGANPPASAACVFRARNSR